MPSNKPIPAFYCCYLLQSVSKPKAHPYVGSTPHILRRWRQHNGLAHGGAVRTATKGYRPWQVACIVHGFPSKLAALQFEWAWQHIMQTRHITDYTGTKAQSLAGKIAHLHYLLQSSTFDRWPLGLHFFSAQVFEAWNRYCRRLSTNRLRDGTHVTLDSLADPVAKSVDASAPTPVPMTSLDSAECSRVHDPMFKIPPALLKVDITYSAMLAHVQKAHVLMHSAEPRHCAICQKILDLSQVRVVVCPHQDCEAVSHLVCASTHFLGVNYQHHVLPVDGPCPQCSRQTEWISLVKELSLRSFSPELITKLLKPRRTRKSSDQVTDGDRSADETSCDSEDDSEHNWLYNELHPNQSSPRSATDQPTDSTTADVFKSVEDFSDCSSDLPPSGQFTLNKWSSPTKRVVPESDCGLYGSDLLLQDAPKDDD